MSTPGDRIFRWITICAFIPALTFLLPYGVENNQVFPGGLGLIPAGLSAFCGVYHLTGHAAHAPPSILTIIMDVFLASFQIGMLIPSWILLANSGSMRYWGDERGMVMLATYGTVPLMVDFCIHTYLALRDMKIFNFFHRFLSNCVSSPYCPHCQREVLFHFQLPGSPSESSDHSRNSYVPVSIVDDQVPGRDLMSKEPAQEPRPSTDDETARLV